MSEDLKIASEVIGEIRKAVRLMEAFKEAEKVANFLIDKEKYLASVQGEISNMEKYHKELNTTLNEVEEKVEAKLKELEATQKLVDEFLASAETKKNQLIEAGQKEAKALIDYAKEQVADLESSKKAIEDQIIGSQKMYDHENSKLQSIKDEVAKQRAVFDKLFGN